MKNLIWESIKGYEGIYEISEYGDIRSLDRTIIKSNGVKVFCEGKDLKIQYDSRSGRPMVRLYDKKTKKGKTFKIHRLVAETFIGERPDGMETCHRDGDILNNHYTNLRYGSKSSNQIDIMKHSGKCAAGKLSVEQVVEIRRAYANKELNQYELAEKFGIKQGSVSEIVNRKTFKFINEDGTIDNQSNIA